MFRTVTTFYQCLKIVLETWRLYWRSQYAPQCPQYIRWSFPRNSSWRQVSNGILSYFVNWIKLSNITLWYFTSMAWIWLPRSPTTFSFIQRERPIYTEHICPFMLFSCGRQEWPDDFFKVYNNETANCLRIISSF